MEIEYGEGADEEHWEQASWGEMTGLNMCVTLTSGEDVEVCLVKYERRWTLGGEPIDGLNMRLFVGSEDEASGEVKFFAQDDIAVLYIY